MLELSPIDPAEEQAIKQGKNNKVSIGFLVTASNLALSNNSKNSANISNSSNLNENKPVPVERQLHARPYNPYQNQYQNQLSMQMGPPPQSFDALNNDDNGDEHDHENENDIHNINPYNYNSDSEPEPEVQAESASLPLSISQIRLETEPTQQHTYTKSPDNNQPVEPEIMILTSPSFPSSSFSPSSLDSDSNIQYSAPIAPEDLNLECVVIDRSIPKLE
jgi:hypothetical protein